MERHEQRMVKFLLRHAAYPHPVPGAIVQRETHVSRVFLAGAFAYKLKKAVQFPFLDASTLARRKRFCQLELTLNRRLAPAVYLEIIPVVETPGGLRLGGTGKVVEWLVKMRRLPEERMLDQLIARRRVSRRQIEAVGDRLIAFFKRAGRSGAISRYGAPEAVRELLLGNLRECQPFVGGIFPDPDRRFLDSAYRQWLVLYGPVLERRVREHRIIDGHGDLRCENICLTGPAHPRAHMCGVGVNIFDCVEFQPAFRCGDMANDFSFLVMDLECRSRPDLAAALVARYRRLLHDPTFDLVLPVYKCHRSLVRGKVRGLAWRQHPDTPQGHAIRRISRRHFALARRYAEQFAPPRVVVVGGLIGTGKSTLARSLADTLGAQWLRTDEIRLNEFERARGSGQGFAEGLYAPRVSELVYQRLIRRAESAIRRGRPVVCDGTFSKVAGRRALRAMARRHGASFHFFQCVVPRAVALRRIARRAAAKSDLSEARPEHYDRLAAGFEPVRGWSSKDWTRLSDDRAPEATFRAALDVLRHVWISPRTPR